MGKDSNTALEQRGVSVRNSESADVIDADAEGDDGQDGEEQGDVATYVQPPRVDKTKLLVSAYNSADLTKQMLQLERQRLGLAPNDPLSLNAPLAGSATARSAINPARHTATGVLSLPATTFHPAPVSPRTARATLASGTSVTGARKPAQPAGARQSGNYFIRMMNTGRELRRPSTACRNVYYSQLANGTAGSAADVEEKASTRDSSSVPAFQVASASAAPPPAVIAHPSITVQESAVAPGIPHRALTSISDHGSEHGHSDAENVSPQQQQQMHVQAPIATAPTVPEPAAVQPVA